MTDELFPETSDNPDNYQAGALDQGAGDDGRSEFDLAIIGMAGRFPGASDLTAFWHNLVNGVESVSRFSDEDVRAAGIHPALSSQPHYVKAGGVLEDAEWFDARFFGFYPREAEIMDPQHRVFLEAAWHALEDAGYDPGTYERAIGVYAGCGMNTYLVYNLAENREIRENVQGYQLTIANDKDFVPTRVAYKLNLRGPAVNVQTACSTSLVATHLACQALLNRDCDMALAGGVSIRLPQRGGYLHQEGGIMSPDGHCRAFDAQAAGTVGGNGVGVVVIKRLADALADGDTIHAVIKGTAINNDGSNKVGYTAPSVEGQTEVIAAAHAVAGVDPRSISYIEAHGTGTALGDPIEIMALSNAFSEADGAPIADGASANDASADGETQWCAIGSLKTNVGHLDAAAGVAGLIKTTLALENRLIPPSLNYSAPNPRIDFGRSPFYVNTKLTEWRSDGRGQTAHPRRAGVSSFGIGGTNAHVVVEEAPPLGPSGPGRAVQLLLLSAKSEEALATVTTNLGQFLEEHPDTPLADAAYTLKVGRQPFAHRRAVVVRDVTDAMQVLSGAAQGRLLDNSGEARGRSVAFMFTGQGSQYPQMGLGLYKSEPAFREAVDRCAELLRPHLGTDIRGLIYPRLGANTDEAAETLRLTNITQPALFVIEYALSQLWLAWGIRPDAMIGHSIGEYVAAHLAGVLSLEDALMIVAARGRLMGGLPGGSMLSLPVGEVEARRLIAGYGELTVATINAPDMVVVAGPDGGVERLEVELTALGIAARRLHTSHAFHSAMMDPILPAFEAIVRGARLQPPTIPYISNLSGGWITAAEATDPVYYARHLRGAVRFAQGLATLAAEPDRVLLEVGPGRTLASLAKSNPVVGRERAVITSLRHPNDRSDDLEFAVGALGQLWLTGIAPTWNTEEPHDTAPWRSFYAGQQRRRVRLPLYPFQRERYWVEPDTKSSAVPAGGEAERATKTADVSRWFYAPSWRRIPRPAASEASSGQVLIFVEDAERDGALVAALGRRTAAPPIVVGAGTGFGRTGEGFTVKPGAVADYEALFRALEEAEALPQTLVYLCSDAQALELTVGAQDFDSLIALAHAWGKRAGGATLQVDIVSAGMFDVTGDDRLSPAMATVLGAAHVIGQEYPGIRVRVLDACGEGADSAPPADGERLADMILGGMRADLVLALRGRRWWAQSFEPLTTSTARPRLRERGVYLITGGLGRIALVLAGHLARTVHARLVLVDRMGLPERTAWPQLLAGNSPFTNGAPEQSAAQLGGPAFVPAAALLAKVRQILALEAAGAEVLVIGADAGDAAAMKDVIAQAVERFGDLHGVIHAAGTVGRAAIRAISETDTAVRAAQFGPKVGGALALAHALKTVNPDFVVLMSSASTVLGGLGFAAYAAANCFLDAFALEQARQGRPWVSASWDGWAFAEDFSLTAAAAAQALSITPEEGVQAFEMLLSVVDEGHVVISTSDLPTRLKNAHAAGAAATTIAERPAGARSAEAPAQKAAGKYARPKMRTAYVEPTNPVEAAIVADWETVLGIAPIGIHDDFFELGGHSLLATQLVSRLRDAYRVELPLRNLFETPTAAGLAALIQRMQSEAEGMGLERGAGVARQAIRRAPRTEELPLSFGQERLWFLDQLTPGSPLYNNFAALRLKAAGAGEGLDPARLEQALNQVIARHDVLRAVFGEREGKPTQRVLPEMKLTIPVVDLRGLPADAVDARVRELALAEARAPFDLGTGPLLRAKLLRTGDDEYVLFFTMHHIISDGWSVGVLIREVATLYEALHERVLAPANLPDLPIQYADYAAWQRDWLSGERREEELAYWRARLTPAPEPLDLATDRPRPAVQTSNGANYWFDIEGETHRKLDALAKGEGATLFMALLAGFQTLLYRYTGQEDICVGTPVANRDHSETEGLIGFLLNTLVLRGDLGPRSDPGAPDGAAPSFRELLARVRETALSAYAHQDLPFETLVEALQPARDMSRAPFFQVMFDLQAAPLAGLTLPGVTLAPVRIDGGTAKFDLALSLEYGAASAGSGTLGGYLNYNTDLFDGETIAAMVEHFRILLADAVRQPDKPISDLSIMSLDEEHRLLVEWNAGGAARAATSHTEGQLNVVRMFEAQAALRPQETAVILADGSGQSLTYAALNERANQMARCLRESGIESAAGRANGDQIVALLLHRSVDMVAAIWAVLKAGAAFLPIDPENPAERTAFILEDSGAVAVIADGAAAAGAAAAGVDGFAPERVFRLDTDRTRFSGQPSHNLDLAAPEFGLAYVIYTSGSTGQPKGVLIEHGGLAQHIVDVTGRFGLRAGDRILQFAAYTFDQGLEQVLTTLTVGGTLVVRGEEIWPPSEFPRIVTGYGLNVVNLPPAYWNQVLQEWTEAENKASTVKDAANVSPLRTIISGGDVLTPESLRAWQATPAAKARMINAYGPTETTITACAFDAPADWFERTSRPTPIGRPLPHRVAYVVDRRRRLTPIGVPGELWLGGNGVARGYLGRAELTAEKFIRDPFISEKAADESARNGRVYCTGDLVRYRRDGNLEFVGRIDQQVKVRGFRIELGEIEAALRTHDAVLDAAVIAPREGHGDGADKRLVAFIVAAGDKAPGGRELRAFLSEKVPGYMIPSAFVPLPALPLNASGKVDRRALEALAAAEPVAHTPLDEFAGPRTPTEAEIAAVWAEVLRVQRVGIYDNFFDLGGHSLLATQIVSRLRAHYPVDLPLRRLFEAPTVAGLARLIEAALIDDALAQQDEGELAALLAELDGLTEDEATSLLAGSSGTGTLRGAEDEERSAGHV